MKQHARGVLNHWRSVFGCGDVDDADSISDLVLRKHSRELPKRKNNPKKTQGWLRQLTKGLAINLEIERKNTYSTSDSNSEGQSTPSTIETISRSYSLSKANPVSDSDETIPAAIETMRIDSFPITDVTGDSQFDELIPAPIEPTQRAYTFENSNLLSLSQRNELALSANENMRRVHSLPNTVTWTVGPLRRQKRNPQREAFFKVRVYDLGHGGDGEILLSMTVDNTQQDDDHKDWPDDFYKTCS